NNQCITDQKGLVTAGRAWGETPRTSVDDPCPGRRQVAAAQTADRPCRRPTTRTCGAVALSVQGTVSLPRTSRSSREEAGTNGRSRNLGPPRCTPAGGCGTGHGRSCGVQPGRRPGRQRRERRGQYSGTPT